VLETAAAAALIVVSLVLHSPFTAVHNYVHSPGPLAFLMPSLGFALGLLWLLALAVRRAGWGATGRAAYKALPAMAASTLSATLWPRTAVACLGLECLVLLSLALCLKFWPRCPAFAP